MTRKVYRALFDICVLRDAAQEIAASADEAYAARLRTRLDELQSRALTLLEKLEGPRTTGH